MTLLPDDLPAVEHRHEAEAEDRDFCVLCGTMFCLDCNVPITYNPKIDRYVHPEPFCWLADNTGHLFPEEVDLFEAFEDGWVPS